MNTDALKAALVALSAQVVTLLVGYGIVNNSQAAKWSALTVSILNAAFLVSHAIHSTVGKK